MHKTWLICNDLQHWFFFSDLDMGSNKLKQRDSANQKSAQSATLTVNERILKDCHQLYMDTENGLCEVSLILDSITFLTTK